MIDLKEFYEVFKCTLLLVSCILCLTCKQSKVLIDDFVYVNPKEPLPVDWLHSEIKDNIQYIPLQSPYKSALGTISRCIVIDTICISTYRDRSGVFFHSLSGNFLHVLNATGKGPMEFDDVNEIAKFDNNHILINDPSKKSIIKYNFRERKIVGEYKTNVDIFSMYYQNEQLIYIGNNFKKGVVQMVENFDFKSSIPLLKGTEISNYVVSRFAFQNLNKNNILISVSFLDTMLVYNFDKKIVEKKYIVGQGETNMSRYPPMDIGQSYSQKNFKRIEDILLPWGIISKIKNYITIPVVPKNTCIILDLDTNKSYFHDFQSNVGKLSYVQTGAYPTIVKNEGNVYYSFMHLLSEPKPIKDRALKLDYIEQYNKLLDEKFENPVIVRFELK